MLNRCFCRGFFRTGEYLSKSKNPITEFGTGALYQIVTKLKIFTRLKVFTNTMSRFRDRQLIDFGTVGST